MRPAKSRIIRNSVTVEHRITKFYMAIHAELVCSQTGIDVNSYFQSAFLEVRKKRPKIPPPTTLGRILVARRFACPPIGPPSFARHKVSGSDISRTGWPRSTKFHTDIRTGLFYNRTGYVVIRYFRLEVIAKNYGLITTPAFARDR